MQAIILAGGKGTRLQPFTATIPKPLVPVDDMPILEIILRQLKTAGVTDVVITVNHLARLIKSFFGDGDELGLQIRYTEEKEPLGTAGPLALVEDLQENFFVLNGDILTTLRFDDLMRSHKSSGAEITIGTFKKEVKIDLGVLETSGDDFRKYIEKPTYFFDVSMGVYAMKKAAISSIIRGQRMDLPELVAARSSQGALVKCFRDNFYWLDIGRPDD
jgi:NDP-sugar pyrophosphorylase family protein